MTEYRNELGQLHRVDGPAHVDDAGNKTWFRNGQRHREDGPAIMCADGTMMWFQNDMLHRPDGPAVEYDKSNHGTKYWYMDGQCHRLNGPAIEHNNGNCEWFVRNLDITKEVESWLELQGFTLPLNEHAQVLFVLKFLNH